MDYGFSNEEVLILVDALKKRIEYYESLPNSKEHRKQIRETQAVLQKIEELDPILRIAKLAKEQFPSSSL